MASVVATSLICDIDDMDIIVATSLIRNENDVARLSRHL